MSKQNKHDFSPKLTRVIEPTGGRGESWRRSKTPRASWARCAHFRNRRAARVEEVRHEQASLRADEAARNAGDATLEIFGLHDEGTIGQMRNCMSFGNVVGGVLAADGHLGYAQPVGGVVAYEDQINVSGVGYDIACGNAAIRLDVPFAAIGDRVGMIANDIKRTISFGVGRVNNERVESELFDDDDAWRASGMADYRQKAAAQLGTVGSGNHYVDVFHDQDGKVWIGAHFGSRQGVGSLGQR